MKKAASIGELVRLQETNFIDGGGTQTSKYVNSDLYEDISKIYAYLESKHISGKTDSQGREKPFFNIVLAARNIYYRATDIDRKDIEVSAESSEQVVPAFLATVLLQNWMQEENYGSFLNDWGLELAGFNSVVVKHVEANGSLTPSVVPWSRLIVDPVNFDKNPKIELLELTEAELYDRVKTNHYDKDMVEGLCDALQARELTDKTKQDQRNNYIKLYEVHGNLPLSMLTGNEDDEDEHVQQMHVISFVESKEKGKFDDFDLYKGKEANDPYMLTSLIPAADGSISLNGSVKNLFQPQWMMNHTVKSIKDQMDIASKLLFQTSDPNYVGRNVLTALEQGDILIHGINQPLTPVNNQSHDITTQQGHMQMWKGLAAEINGVSESMMGQVAPSGTAWRQVEALLNESHDLFELMTENKGLYIEKMLRTYVIPFLKKQMDTSEEISGILDAHAITKLDAMYVPRAAIKKHNEQVKQALLNAPTDGSLSNENMPQPFDKTAMEGSVQADLAPLGNQRFFKPDEIDSVTWKTVLKDLEWKLMINITGEAKDLQKVMTTLNTALNVIMNPLYGANKQAQFVVGKILSQTSVLSPLELASMPPPPPPPAPAAAPPGGLPAQPTVNA